MRSILITAIFIGQIALMGQECFAESFNIEKCICIIMQAESSGRYDSIGDNGKARGAYQIQEATWKRYSKLKWSKYAHDPKESRIVASCIVSDIVRGLKRGNHPVTYGNVCAWYNYGHYKAIEKWNTRNRVYQGIKTL